MESSKAVYAGSFDPFTVGHANILKQALPLFDIVVLAVGVNPTKKCMFTVSDRMTMLQDLVMNYDTVSGYRNLCVDSFDGVYLVNYAQRIGARYIIRGIRNTADFEYENAIAQINRRINPKVQTVFFFAEEQYAKISSSMVKGLIGPEDWEAVAEDYIPWAIWPRFAKFAKLTSILSG